MGGQRAGYPGLCQQCTKFPFSLQEKGKPLENSEWEWGCHALIKFLTILACQELIMETNKYKQEVQLEDHTSLNLR